MKEPTKLGAKPKADPKERRLTRSLPLNDYEHAGLKALANAAGAKSVGDFLVKRLKLPSTAIAEERFIIKQPS